MPKKSHLVKDIVSEQKTPRYLAVAFVLLFRPKKVSGIQYGVFSGRDMNRISVVEVNATSAWGKSVMNSDIFNPINREPTPNGVLDRSPWYFLQGGGLPDVREEYRYVSWPLRYESTS